ncbi:MAG: hypothetical protein HYY93_10575 [Planctomycetes bacterium]|nr:hypothetical protein [Planctomycetota bacterium]
MTSRVTEALPPASVAVTVNVKVPMVVGMPVSVPTPVPVLPAKASPGGTVPLVTA